LSCSNQYAKNSPFNIKKRGINKVKTATKGYNLGAKKGIL
jgi:hypothetical protein